MIEEKIVATATSAPAAPTTSPAMPKKKSPRGGGRGREWSKPVVRRIKVFRTDKDPNYKETDSKTGGLKIVHLGGLGEIGRNMSAIQYDDDIILIDCGLRWAEENMPGIDSILPNVGWLEDKKDMVKAMFFTHGHMDHIGALPFLRDKIGDPDIYAAPLTRAIMIKRQDDFKFQKPLVVNEVKAGDEIKISDKISVKVLRINHSIPDDLEIVIKTPLGHVVHTSDYKFDDTPVNDLPADIEEMKRIADEGVLLLMSDSTGAESEGHSLSEQDVTKNLEKLFSDSTGMVIVGTFASLINRIQQIITISEKFGRKVVFDGYSMKSNVEICKKLGYLKLQKGTQITMDEVHNYPREKVTAIVTGAQGEGNAVLMRIASGEHKHLQTHKKDTYIFSSSVVPGNERNVQFLKDQLYRNGAQVFNYKMLDIHAGGHGSKEDLRRMIQLIKPRFLMPIHGQYSMMVNHKFLGMEEGIPENNIIIADNGTVTHVEKDKWWFDKKQAPSDYVFVDGLGIGDIGNVVLRDRQILAADGFIVVITLVDANNGKVKGSPDIISRGFIYLKDNKELLGQIRKKIKYIVEAQNITNPNLAYLKDQIRNQVGQFLFQKTERRPMVLPVILEV
ncbi:MAG: RNA-metabolising metallo-beta-lactamase [Candidatus Yanofskybacteria bacterium GW2011_GWF1_44_227]|uniref:Ribonuclease J n=1 Tax=Candidatus Yanofskybacteria bacterium GW2011_GWE2_40_11 TaxID=1619033 RepID=A0A0G0QKM8_9BACT|nr:MAG: RNA-metabolising metallo-beta-lactamase [Candidatus Yanofskybacteria bacterium GW2011_GWE1_40_10]KKR40979.1 MAG: RNA-metabolising metallo-beta-lactamase [Candidatus Yanofskybacteria bacterium GW2011_GWE2_40_11]KKT15541.1 MAG: RNA-metabolising metallo-beta-lactamase [Candidatus Yanofskybacteria bacterium GW2011_GWF2_43_596]KKT53210.1 MAG: RNA-metabolising metallo-beta-lactamase [Candidatus Yanofskybacteria bacterium GW2011_GWF1_44_227]HAU07410.1 ribonuclease J [Candidatus Yanofskybacteri